MINCIGKAVNVEYALYMNHSSNSFLDEALLQVCLALNEDLVLRSKINSPGWQPANYLCRDRMVRVLRVRARPSWRRVQPAAHRGANEEGPGDYAGDADVTHRFNVVFG